MTKRIIFSLLGLAFGVHAANVQDDAINQRNQLLLQMKSFNPALVLPQFTTNPVEMALKPEERMNNLPIAANQRIATDSLSKEVYQQAVQGHAQVADMSTPEMQKGGDLIEQAEHAPGDVACATGQCDSTVNEVSNDINEGVLGLGAVATTADEVSSRQIGLGNPSLFTGSNYQCRIAVAGIGNCCGGNARFLNCRGEEKVMAVAIIEGRADKVGRYCAVRKLGICWEEKESWCVFPTKFAGIIQHQGRFGQLGINFGWAQGRNNVPNCRGITPEELARINFQALDLSAVLQDFKSRKLLPNPQAQMQMNQAHIDQLHHEGRAYD
jgi:hypothetical protein